MSDDGANRDPLSLKIAVSTVNYGGSAMILEGLPTLLAELSRFADHHVLLVDNASPDGDGDRLAEAVARDYADAAVTLIRSPVNGGFAAGNNIAFEAALEELPFRPDGVFLLNPDATVYPGTIEQLAAVMLAKPAAGVIAPVQENPDGSIMRGAFNFPSALNEFVKGTGIGRLIALAPTMAPEASCPVRVDWVTGCAQLLRAEAIEAASGMDHGYFLYFDEVDMARRLAPMGWQCWHVPDARVRHVGGATTGVTDGKARAGRMPAYWFRSWLRYYALNHGPAYARLAAAAKIAGTAVGIAQQRLRGRDPALPPHYLGDLARRTFLGSIRDATADPGPQPMPERPMIAPTVKAAE